MKIQAIEIPTVPTQQQLLRPFLEILADGVVRSLTEVERAVCDRLELGPDTRSVQTESGVGVLANRIGWARTALVKAELVDQPASRSQQFARVSA